MKQGESRRQAAEATLRLPSLSTRPQGTSYGAPLFLSTTSCPLESHEQDHFGLVCGYQKDSSSSVTTDSLGAREEVFPKTTCGMASEIDWPPANVEDPSLPKATLDKITKDRTHSSADIDW